MLLPKSATIIQTPSQQLQEPFRKEVIKNFIKLQSSIRNCFRNIKLILLTVNSRKYVSDNFGNLLGLAVSDLFSSEKILQKRGKISKIVVNYEITVNFSKYFFGFYSKGISCTCYSDNDVVSQNMKFIIVYVYMR